LGGGSNVLFSDKGYEGMVIKIRNKRYKTQGTRIICTAGMLLSEVLGITTKKGFTGLEWAAGIPGTIGGAIFGNAGAFGRKVEDVLNTVKVIDLISFQEKIFKKNQCQFSYRNSLFKKNKKYIIIETELKFKKREKKGIQTSIKKNLLYRCLYHPLKYPSVGSIFKNPELRNKSSKLIKRFPDFRKFLNKEETPAAYLIDRCELKGKKIGGAQVSEKHPNFIININNAKAEDVIILISLVKQKVRNKFGIELEEEINYVGF
jgi:UDP-N-acetylmuramate dehydrogenase